ncbi:MAG: hypothetical protein ABSA33_01865 [Candidatus Micrarchaeaceae archaeon]|jgi:hypothetical protein
MVLKTERSLPPGGEELILKVNNVGNRLGALLDNAYSTVYGSKCVVKYDENDTSSRINFKGQGILYENITTGIEAKYWVSTPEGKHPTEKPGVPALLRKELELHANEFEFSYKRGISEDNLRDNRTGWAFVLLRMGEMPYSFNTELSHPVLKGANPEGEA